MKTTIKRTLALIMALALSLSMFVTPALAVGEGSKVSSALTNTWSETKATVLTIVNNVVFPIVQLLLVILLLVKIATAYLDYRKHGQLEWTGPAIILFCLIFAFVAPTVIGTIIS